MILLIAAAVCAASSPSPVPRSASVVPVLSEQRDYGIPIGNIKVQFSDGHSELWTKDGRSLLPHVSRSGVVGWSRFVSRNVYGEPFNNLLRIHPPDRPSREFQVGRFIEDWGFSDDGVSVSIKCRGRHGPSYLYQYEIGTGKLLDSITRSVPYDGLPEWAKPFADDKPRT